MIKEYVKNAMLGEVVAGINSIFQNYQIATIMPKREFADFTGFVVLEENSTDELEITAHPVQSGAEISDHAYLKPAMVTTRFMYGVQSGELWDIYTKLRELQEKRELFDVVTGKRDYSNMLLKTLSVNTDKSTENVLSVTADFQQVILAKVETTTLPPKENQKMPNKTGSVQNMGNKNAKKVTDEQSATLERSALFNISRSF